MNHRAITALTMSVLIFGAQASWARDSKLLNEVVDSSNAERATVERDYRVESHLTRDGDVDEVRAMHLEIGDELGPENHGGPLVEKHSSAESNYREKGVSKKLESEWKEVNRGMREGHENSAGGAGASHVSRSGSGASSGGGRSHKYGRASSDAEF